MEREQLSPDTSETAIADMFRAAGYDIESTVGKAPGQVIWLAVPLRGLVRPRTHFQVFSSVPEDIERTLGDLEAMRIAASADRAIGIVTNGQLPDGYAPDLLRRSVNLLSVRRWLIELLEVLPAIEGQVRWFEGKGFPSAYLPRRGRLASGEEVQVEEFLDSWLLDRSRHNLLIDGPGGCGKTTVIDHAIYRSARRFLARPEVEPILIDPTSPPLPFNSALIVTKMAVAALSA